MINHLSGKPHDNRVENLEWTTDKGNGEHALRTGLKKVRKVEQYSLDGKYIKTFSSIKDATKEFDCNYSTVWDACGGRSKTCKGYKLKFVE